MRLKLGYMTREQELSVISRASTTDIIASLETAVTPEETQYLKENYKYITVHPSVAGYMMDIIEGTRKESAFVTGVSTRGAMALYKAAQATAALRGRDYMIPEDVKYTAPFVLGHRLSYGDGKTVERILESVTVPLENV